MDTKIVTMHEVIYQSVVAFLFLFILARLLGKRQIAQLTFFDYIAGITIGNIAAGWSLDQTKTRFAIVSLLIWTLLSIILSFIQRKSYLGRVALDGRPVVLIQNGQVLDKHLGKAKISIEELMLMLRQKDIFQLSDVEYAVFENNGAVSVLKKSEVQPLTPRDIRLPVLEEREARLVIIDGNVMDKSLADSGYTREWLLGEITKQGAQDFKDVFLAELESDGNVYVDLYNDSIQPPTVKKKSLVAASLKKIQADMEIFAYQTRNEQAKQSYAKMAGKLESIIEDIDPYLKD